MALSSSLLTRSPFPSPQLFPSGSSSIPRTSVFHFRVNAKLGGGSAESKKGEKKKFITREEEPQQYWQTAGEKEGENPMMTPIPYIIIFGMSTPFIILAIAFANGWIKVPIR
nr:steroid 17-alpha-hydroxylase [Fagopyrum tataricum]